MNTVPNIRICEHCRAENHKFHVACWKCGLWKGKTYPQLSVAQSSSQARMMPGMRASKNGGIFRCHCCKELKDSEIVGVPYVIQLGDDPVMITEICRNPNGERVGWCVPCAQSLCPPPKPYRTHQSIFSKLFDAIKSALMAPKGRKE